MRPIAALAPLALLAALAGSPALAATGNIAMTGHGEVMAAPDTAYVTSGVTSQGATARDAVAANTRDMAALVDVLKSVGVDPKDIQTSGFSVNPNYVYSDQKDANGYQLPPRINGYTVSNGVTVHVRDLAGLGALLDKMVTVGANTINGVSFTVDDPSKLYDDARRQAFADARHKADLYATAAGVTLGSLASINEGVVYTQPPQPVGFADMAVKAASAPVPVEAGQVTYSIDVNVTWNLAQTD